MILPNYEDVMEWEGLGNYAIKKYYKWPFRFLYRKKLQMALNMLDEDTVYSRTLDFGCGPARIFEKELARRSLYVDCVDRLWDIPEHYYELITCLSVLEFVDLPATLKRLDYHMADNGILVVASPILSPLSKLYYRLCGSKYDRNSKEEILKQIKKQFIIEEYTEWFGLYFCLRAKRK